MVEHPAQLDAIFHALSDPTRRAMLGHLTEREQTIGELATPFRMSLAGASKHIKVLERAGLVSRRVVGRTHFCALRAAQLKQANQWLKFYERYWSENLDTLETLLRQEDEAKKEP